VVVAVVVAVVVIKNMGLSQPVGEEGNVVAAL
jgi:hypothetical protein